MTIDFGFHELVSLGNRVWFDPDNSGLHESGEDGIAGVEVHLHWLDGTLAMNYDQIPCITTTDSMGHYLFDRLVPGFYLVRLPEENFAEGAPLEGMTNSQPTLFDPNLNSDRADHGIMPGDGELASFLAHFGSLSGEDLIPQGELLPGFEGTEFFEEFIFDETIPEQIMLPIEEGVETIVPPTLPINTLTLVFNPSTLAVGVDSSAPVSQATTMTVNNAIGSFIIPSGGTSTGLAGSCSAPALVTISAANPAIDGSDTVFEFDSTGFTCCAEPGEPYSIVTNCCSGVDASGLCGCIASGLPVVGDPAINCCSGVDSIPGTCD